MCTTTVCIVFVIRLTYIPSFISLVHEIVNVFVTGDSEFAQVLYVGAEEWMFPHAEVALVVWIKEVTDALAIDLHVAHLRRTERGDDVRT